MTIIYFDLAVLSAKADELEGLNERLLGEITTMNETESALAGMWEGPAKESFRQAYERDAVQMKNFYCSSRTIVRSSPRMKRWVSRERTAAAAAD